MALGVDDPESFEFVNSRTYGRVPEMVDYLYQRLQRRGYLQREVERMVNQDRNTFAAHLLALGEADTLSSGVTRRYGQTISQLRRVLDAKPGCSPLRIHRLVCHNHTIFMAHTTLHGRPTSEKTPQLTTHTPPA